MSDIIKQAKELIGSTEAQLALSGDINATIFRGKNFFGMVDKQEMVITPQAGTEIPMNAEDIVKNVPQLEEGE